MPPLTAPVSSTCLWQGKQYIIDEMRRCHGPSPSSETSVLHVDSLRCCHAAFTAAYQSLPAYANVRPAWIHDTARPGVSRASETCSKYSHLCCHCPDSLPCTSGLCLPIAFSFLPATLRCQPACSAPGCQAFGVPALLCPPSSNPLLAAPLRQVAY